MKKTLVLVCLVVAVFGLVALVLLVVAPGGKEVPMPKPNGYDDLVRAGQMARPGKSEISESELRLVVASNAPALELARTGLSKECRVTQHYSATSSAKLDQLSATKNLSQAFLAEARLAELEKRPADAARSCLDLLRIASACTRGGIMLDSMTSLAMENQSLSRLEILVPTLDPGTLRVTIAALEKFEQERVAIEDLKRNEEVWARKTYGWKAAVLKVATYKVLRAHHQRWQAQVQKQRSHNAALLLLLATRAYEIESGAAPNRVDDLVPRYLKMVPPQAQPIDLRAIVSTNTTSH